MISYVARRCIQALIILVGLTVFLFTLFKAQGLGPCQALLDNPIPGIGYTYQGCIAHYGLDQPLPIQYLKWLQLSVQGDFGLNYLNVPVLDTIGQRLPATIILIGVSYIFQELVALPLGLLAALRRRSMFDDLLSATSFLFLSVPTFWLSTMLILLFAVKLGWAPVGGVVSALSPNPVVANIPAFGGAAYWGYVVAHPWATLTDLAAHLALPALTLAVAGIAADSRFMRASMLRVTRTDYVRTARAKGLSPRRVILTHALRNAMLPLITNLGLFIPTVFSGAIVVETIFGWPGVGAYFIGALQFNDNNTLLAILLLAGLLTLVGNVLTDVLYSLADPRIVYD